MPKVKLSPEENKALKVQKKLEKKLQKEELKRQIKRDHLEREIKFGALTVKRYEKGWREMLIKVALPRMRQELEYAWHNFERVVDAKDFTISLLMDELNDAEEQYMLNFRTHTENMDKLIDMFHERLEELERDNDHQVKELEDRCDEEVRMITEAANDAFEFLKTMLYGLEVAKKEQERMIRGEYYAKLDEEEVRINLVLQRLKGVLERKYNQMYDDTKAFLKSFNKMIKERKKQHNELKQVDDAMQSLIIGQFNQIKMDYDLIKVLRQKYSDMQQVEGHKFRDLLVEKKYFGDVFVALKLKLQADRKEDQVKLICLSESSNVALEYLEKLCTKGEHILKVSGICRKLETIREKILPFPLPGQAEQAAEARAEEVQEDGDTLETKAMRKELDLFWQRVGQAGCLGVALTEKKEALVNENNFFVAKFNLYCDRMMYPSVTLKNRFKEKPEVITVVDGAELVKRYSSFDKYMNSFENVEDLWSKTE